MYTKLNLLPAKIASTSDIKPALTMVMFDGARTVATDSFRLLEVSTVDGEKTTPVFIDAQMVKKHKVPAKDIEVDINTISLPNPHVEYPNIDMIMKEKSSVEYAEIKVNGQLLGELLQVMSKINKYGVVTLKVPINSHYEAIHLYADAKKTNYGTPTQTAHGLCMPINK